MSNFSTFKMPVVNVQHNLMQAAVAEAIEEGVPEIDVEASRGAGKSTVLGKKIKTNVKEMPKSTGIIVGATYVQIKTVTLAATKAGLKMYGLHEDIHYVVGECGKKKGFEMPFHSPDSWHNVIHFFNGTIAIFVSLDSPNGGRGLNASWVVGDEAALLDSTRLFDNVLAANRTVKAEFKYAKSLNSLMFVSSVAMTKRGEWFTKRDSLSQKHPRKYRFIKANSYVNAYNLRKGWIADMKREAESRISFEAEILNIRPRGVQDGFYPQLKIKHYYNSKDDLALLGGVTESYTHSCKYDRDLIRNVPLDFNLDFGGKINCGTVSQYLKSTNELNFIKEFHAKSVDSEKLSDLVHKFIEYYEPHKASCNVVNLYHDRSGYKEEANSKTTLAEDVENLLRKAGWRVINRTPNTNNPGHIVKYRLIETILSETDHELPTVRINQDRCPNLIISLENAAVTHKKDGYEKDKSSEKSKTIPQEHATHYSDTFDYRLFWGFGSIIDPAYSSSMIVTNL